MKILRAILLGITILLVQPISYCQLIGDNVQGNLIQFNDNGAWCWYQDERAILDTENDKMIIGSDASRTGTGGNSRNGLVEGYIYDLNSGFLQRKIFRTASCDDHNTAAFLLRPDGKYLTMYADHYDDRSRYRTYDGNIWSDEEAFLWNTIPGGTNFTTTYSNLFYLEAEDKVYNFSRCHDRSPNMIVSTDQGETWTYGGLLTEPDASIGYVNGYFKYSSDMYDRIDFVATEHHPRDFSTSIYHGYIRNGQSFNSEGILMDTYIGDKHAPTPDEYTLVFEASTVVNEITMTRCWNIDIQNYNSDTITILFKARANDDEMDHRYFYARYNGTSWISTYLCKAGWKLYDSEQDYTGLGALDPANPNIIYVSTPFDPRNDEALGVREIFKGETKDQGASWSWKPITQNSTRDNLRPIAPLSDRENTTLLWMRGTYVTAQSFDMTIVGLIEKPDEYVGVMTYMDATTENTTLADGTNFVPTGPSADEGVADDLWHQRSGMGNGNNIFTSAELEGEDAATIKTSFKATSADTFDVWVNFWASTLSDWRIKAGFTEGNMQLFRHIACKQVDEGKHTTSLVLTDSDTTFLYQAYLGRTVTNADSTIDVFIDDHAIQTGSVSDLVGNEARTWYDGISFTLPRYLKLSTKQLVVNDTAESKAAILVNSNTNWSAESSEDWLLVSSNDFRGTDTLIVSADVNSENVARMASIIITADSISQQIVKVVQSASTPVVTVTPSVLYIEAEANSMAKFALESNTLWTLECSENWLKTSSLSGLNNEQIQLSAALNPLSTPRVAIVTALAEGAEPQFVSVTQAGNPILYVSIPTLGMASTAESIARFTVKSNTDWIVNTNTDWLISDLSSGSGVKGVVLEAAENNTYEERHAVVTVSSNGLADQIVSITQAAAIPPSSFTDNGIDKIQLYPNPAQDRLFMHLTNLPAEIRLLTLGGKQLRLWKIQENMSSLNLKDLKQGIYLIEVKTDSQTITKKLIIE